MKVGEKIPERDDLNKAEVIALAMEAFQWKELKCLSWYKLQNNHLGGNSPMELVQRGQTSKIVAFLKFKTQERLNRNLDLNETNPDPDRFEY